MIARLHQWIQLKGKPAIERVMELEDQCGDYEQQISILEFRVATLSDEVAKMNEEKLVLQSKYEALHSDKTDLQEKVKTVNQFTYSNSMTDALDIPDIHEVSRDSTNYQAHIDQLNARNANQLKEIADLRKWNGQYLEEVMSLRKKVEQKEKEIAVLSQERNEWEDRYGVTEQDLRLSVQRMKELNSENENFKFQMEQIEEAGLEVGVPDGLTAGALRKLSTADPYFVHKPHHQQTRTIGAGSEFLSLSGLPSRKTSWRSDVTVNTSINTSINTKYGSHRSEHPSLVEPLMEAGDVTMYGDNTGIKLPALNDVAGLDIRSVRLTLWCVIFWIFSVAELSYYAHLLNANPEETYLVLFIVGDAFLIIGVLSTLNHIYLGYGAICGGLFVIGGFLHMAETSVYVQGHCHDTDCVVLRYGNDLCAECLSIFLGIDILTQVGDARVMRVICLSGILAISCMMIASVWKESDSADSIDNLRKGAFAVEEVALWITGAISALLFMTLCIMTMLGIRERNLSRNVLTHSLNAVVGFMLLHSAGLLFYALPGYQVLLMLTTASMISYEMIFM